MNRFARRGFLKGLGGSVILTSGGRGVIESLAQCHASELLVTPELVRLRPEMEPIVRWIEQTPRERILDEAAAQLRRGLPYRQLLGGLFLAGIRNIKPRPVGFKFHAVMVINSAHQLSLDAPQSDRLLPFFWALDNFKNSQAQDEQEGDWVLGPVDESAVPPPHRARAMFQDAMDRWDESAADAAVAGLCRSAGAAEVMELLWPYGARDWQNIGHKIIFTAQSWRVLQTIGWENAEPVLRSLVYGLLNGGPGETAASYAENRKLAETVRKDWAEGRPDPSATHALLTTFREAGPQDSARAVMEHLERGVAASSMWDAVLLAAGELLMRRPGIVSLHATTSCNSLHFGFQASGQDTTRLVMLLQAASWIALFREAVRSRNGLPDKPLLDAFAAEPGTPPPDLEQVFHTINQDRFEAARQVFALAKAGRDTSGFRDAARHLIFTKGTDAHDYKFAAATFEELLLANDSVRPELLATSVFQLRGAGEPDSPLQQKAMRALAQL